MALLMHTATLSQVVWIQGHSSSYQLQHEKLSQSLVAKTAKIILLSLVIIQEGLLWLMLAPRRSGGLQSRDGWWPARHLHPQSYSGFPLWSLPRSSFALPHSTMASSHFECLPRSLVFRAMISVIYAQGASPFMTWHWKFHNVTITKAMSAARFKRRECRSCL